MRNADCVPLFGIFGRETVQIRILSSIYRPPVSMIIRIASSSSSEYVHNIIIAVHMTVAIDFMAADHISRRTHVCVRVHAERRLQRGRGFGNHLLQGCNILIRDAGLAGTYSGVAQLLGAIPGGLLADTWPRNIIARWVMISISV